MTNENPSAWGVLSDAERALVADAARLSGAATEGPWLLDGPWWHGRDEAVPLVVTTDRRAIVIEPPASEAAAGANVEFVAWSRTGIPGLLAVVDRLAAEVESADRPAPCEMVHTPPFDFANCLTHDTTFPLGSKCEWDGVESIFDHLDSMAREQRGRAVRAEMRLADAAAERGGEGDE